MELKKVKKILSPEDQEKIVYKYSPKEFTNVPLPEAEEFIVRQIDAPSEFKLADLVSEQVKISEIHRKCLQLIAAKKT